MTFGNKKNLLCTGITAVLLYTTGILLAGVLSCLPAQADVGPVWTFHGQIADGNQMDALAGPDGIVHLVSNRYYQFDRKGNILVNENPGDGKQGSMDFPPAIAVDSTGTAHLLTRHDGSANGGYDIRYRRRTAAGSWDRDIIVGSREKRNYVVGIAAASPDAPFLHYSRAGSDVWGNLLIWGGQNGSIKKLGEIDNIWRSDTDARMRAAGNRIFLVSGKCDSGGSAYFSHAAAGPSFLTEMKNNMVAHQAGTGRRGTPDIAVDKLGQAHITYGAYQEVYYNRYNAQQQKAFGSDRRIFSGLNDWHLGLGLSAVAASDDGAIVVAVALRSDGSKGATNSDLLWSFSMDGGATWSEPQDLGVNTDGGEGRHRPRLVAVDRTFMLFFNDTAAAGISLATTTFPDDRPPFIIAPVSLLLQD